MTPLPSRLIATVEVAPGLPGLRSVQRALRARLDDDGPAFGMVPAVSRHVTQGYADLVRSAVEPGQPGGHADAPEADAPELDDADTAVIVATSGSTGAPRGVLITRANLIAAWSCGNAARPGLAECGWVLALPVTSAGGFAAVVRAHLSGRPLVPLDSIGGAGPFRPDDLLALDRPDPFALSIVPSQLVAILDSPRVTAWLAEAHSVIVGAAATPPELVARARQSGVHVVPSYGMTETSGGCVYDGIPMPGMEVTLDRRDFGTQQPEEESGRIVIRGPMVAAGYLGHPDETALRFGGDAPSREFHTRDIGVWRDGRLEVLGRLDDVVTVYGVNVSLGAIEALARTEIGVADVAAVAVPDAERGNRIVAYVVASHPATLAAIGPLVAERLGSAARPEVVGVTALPYLPNGKIDRQALSRTARS